MSAKGDLIRKAKERPDYFGPCENGAFTNDIQFGLIFWFDVKLDNGQLSETCVYKEDSK